MVVVGKNIVEAPLVFLGDTQEPGGGIVYGPLSLVKSSNKLPLLRNGDVTRVAEVGRLCVTRGKAPPTIVCGEGGGRVGVLGSDPGTGGAIANGEYIGPGALR